ncbi:hypothetical protein DGG96_17860 [Legionella qingyii]|uniref:Uncharacterized protein n=1 Tax=Legionella qingyii TaxID=2184757 RepID=A0A317TXN0_9GAMM|nr:hypothetical protein DGG96_17860 [Legionella qingyii]
MVLADFTVEQLSNSMFYCNHDQLIENRESYNKIKGLRHAHPSKALMLILYNLYRKMASKKINFMTQKDNMLHLFVV